MALEIRSNSRQIPKHIEYTSSKIYHDMVYGYIQSISKQNLDGTRYVNAKDITNVSLANNLDISEPTARKYRVGLQELGLLGEKEKGKFQLTFLPEEYAMLVPLDVLEVLVKRERRYLISLYIYCLGRYIANNYQYFPYSLNTVKEYIGIATNTYSNSDIISNNMKILDLMNLLTFKQIRTMENGSFITTQTIGNVVNKLND